MERTQVRIKKIEFIGISILLVVAFFLRSYAFYRDVFFGYDQGRDAFVMQKFMQGDFTLIGPTTGLDGVFLGPFYYYLLFPFYWIGNGNPLYAGFALILLHVALVGLIYLWGKKLKGMWTGAIAASLFAVSHTNIDLSRWISNPVPLPFFALLAFGALWLAFERKKYWGLLIAGALFGICLQLEAANAMWFIPTVAVYLGSEVALDKKAPTFFKKMLVFTVFGLITTFGFLLASAPQLLFEFRHNFLTTRNIITAFQTTHDVTLRQSLPTRLPWLFDLYARSLFPGVQLFFWLAIIGVCAAFFWQRKQLIENRALRIIALWFLVPLFFHTIYTGNHGNFWAYYVIGQYPALFLLVAWMLTTVASHSGRLTYFLRIGVCSLYFLSIILNVFFWKNVLTPYEGRYSLDQQVHAANWVMDTAKDVSFGVWIYTPSYQDEADRYVLWWIGRQRGVTVQRDVEKQPLIYLFVEEDTQHLQRRQEWIEEKKKFGQVLAEKRFGAFTIIQLQNTFLDHAAKTIDL